MTVYGKEVLNKIPKGDWLTTAEIKEIVPEWNPNKMCYTLNRLFYQNRLEKRTGAETQWKAC